MKIITITTSTLIRNRLSALEAETEVSHHNVPAILVSGISFHDYDVDKLQHGACSVRQANCGFSYLSCELCTVCELLMSMTCRRRIGTTALVVHCAL